MRVRQREREREREGGGGGEVFKDNFLIDFLCSNNVKVTHSV